MMTHTNGTATHTRSEARPWESTPPRPDLAEGSRMFSRDLSWLEFNRRVLQLAMDETLPLLERVKFIAIFSNNLDEFIMKRVGALRQRLGSGDGPTDLEPWPVPALFDAVRESIRQLQDLQTRCYEEQIRPALAREGIELLSYAELTAEDRRRVDVWFSREVFPVLTPLAVDPGHRFPFISNLSENVGVLVTDSDHAEPMFARVKVPAIARQWVRIPDAADGSGGASGVGRGRFVHLSEVIRNNLDDLFPGMRIVEAAYFRVYRNAEVQTEDDDDTDNLLELVEAQLKKRRFAEAVRLEVSKGMSRRMLGPMMEELELTPLDVQERTGPLDYVDLNEIVDLDRADLKNRPWKPVVPRRLADKAEDIFSVIRRGDLLVHHPYESFEASAQRFIAEAARDPAVLAIKQTIYRTSRDSPFISSLIRAAESGKQVACLVELRARFDEQSNVRFAQMLENAGVHVAYGVVGLKTHCKAALVVRRETDEQGRGILRSYAHLGTGNYHPKTAQLYTDVSLFTADPALTDDVVDLFNFLTGRSRKQEFRSLLVAPMTMRRRFVELIDRERRFAKEHREGARAVGGRIVCKMNAFADSDVMEALYAASEEGVDVTLLVRGFCCLRPGVPGMSQRIRVVSVVGRFLEHSRIFHFGAGSADPLEGDWYVGSADWMYRNLSNRVESAYPVRTRENRAVLAHVFDVMLRDHRRAWLLGHDGVYTLRTPPEGLDASTHCPERDGTFEVLMHETMAAAQA
jgi:polyphosphate kinase